MVEIKKIPCMYVSSGLSVNNSVNLLKSPFSSQSSMLTVMRLAARRDYK